MTRSCGWSSRPFAASAAILTRVIAMHLEGYGATAPEGRDLVMLASAWVPFLAFVRHIAPDLLDEKLAAAAVLNEGARVEQEVAFALADRLTAALDAGVVDQAVAAMGAAPGAPPPLGRLTVLQVRGFVAFVRASKGFAVW